MLIAQGAESCRRRRREPGPVLVRAPSTRRRCDRGNVVHTEHHSFPKVILRGICVAGLVLGLGACKQEVQFTKAAPIGPSPPAARKVDETLVHVTVPVDLAPAIALAQTALPDDLGRIVDWLDDAACGRRGRGTECNGARVDIQMTRNGPVTLHAQGADLVLAVPLKYDLAARGLGWARDIREQRTGEIEALIRLDVTLRDGFEPEVQLAETIKLSQPSLSALKGRIGIARHLDQRLRKPLRPVAEAVRTQLAAAGLHPRAQAAWQALFTPIELSREPQLWIRPEPRRIAGLGLTEDKGQLSFRIAIRSRMSVHKGQRPAPLLPRAMPAIERVERADQPAEGAAASLVPSVRAPSTLDIPVFVSWDSMRAAVRKAFPEGEVIRPIDEGGQLPTAVKLRKIDLFPSRGRLGIEMELDVVEPAKWYGLIGTAQLVGRPVVRKDGVLEVEAIELYGQPTRAGRPRPEPRPSDGTRSVRLALEPFGSRIARHARLDIGSLVRDILPHVNGLIGQPIGDGLRLDGRFEGATIVGIDPVRGGFEVVFRLEGRIAIETANQQAGAVPGLAEGQIR